MKKKDIEASLKSKIQAYLVMAGVVIAAAGILYWNYFQTQVPPVSEITIKENFHTPLDLTLVYMVNDAYMGKPQIPVPVNGKTYYAPGFLPCSVAGWFQNHGRQCKGIIARLHF